jgi:glutathione synthase/RimK-type ligase-like ATP-grasp enzyme
MKKLVLVPNNMGSAAARGLAEVLSTKVGHKVWRVTPQRVGKRVAYVLKNGTDKLTQMQQFLESGVATPEFTSDPMVARSWLPEGAVMCRTVLLGSQGRGIVVAENEEALVPAPLYTKYFKKKKEFRVHVFNGEVIDVQEKRKKEGFDGQRDTRIRNLSNGYVFCRNSITEPDGLRELAKAACAALGYSLGAVDIAYNEHLKKSVVLEVNANPGMEGTTLENYANAIVGWYKGVANAL